MYDFARQLSFWSTNRIFAKDLKWQFVGHSMGTMVLNELFRVAPDIRAERITYMAAACSIRDFQESLVPYLRRSRLRGVLDRGRQQPVHLLPGEVGEIGLAQWRISIPHPARYSLRSGIARIRS